MWVITTATPDEWVNLDKASRIEFSTTDEGSCIQAFIGPDLGAILAHVPAGADHDDVYEKVCDELHSCMRSNTGLCNLNAVVKRYERKRPVEKGATRKLAVPADIANSLRRPSPPTIAHSPNMPAICL